MTTADPHGPAPVGVSASLALVVGGVCFAALSILGLGMTSFFTNTDVVSVEGLSMWPGIVGMIVAIILYGVVLGVQLRPQHPRFSAALLAALVAVVGHLIAVWVSAMADSAGYAHAFAAIAQLVTGGSSAVLLVSGLLAGLLAIALRRSRGGTPQWPWERHGT